MPRRRSPQSPRVVHRTARAGLRVTPAQRRRLLGLLVSAGDVWACVLELNAWRRARQDRPLADYQVLCRELACAGPGTFGELDTVGARSVLRRYSDAWFAAAKRRREGDRSARFPRRRRKTRRRNSGAAPTGHRRCPALRSIPALRQPAPGTTPDSPPAGHPGGPAATRSALARMPTRRRPRPVIPPAAVAAPGSDAGPRGRCGAQPSASADPGVWTRCHPTSSHRQIPVTRPRPASEHGL